MDLHAIELSRLQFGLTAIYHFIFVPLTIGLAFIASVMETIHLKTKNPVWRDAARFWGKFFFVNWLFGVCTGLPLRLQLANNWEHYSAYIGPVIKETFFIEGVIAPFLFGAAFIFALGWKRLSPLQHTLVSWALTALLSIQSISILAINAWMGTPVGVEFGPGEASLTNLLDVYLSPITLDKFGHTMSAAAVTGAVFVMAVSAWLLLKGRHREVARRSFITATIVGVINVQIAMVMGHLSAFNLARHQPMKFAAIEGMWETRPVPAPLTVFALPDMETQSNRFAVEAPGLLTVLAAPGSDRTFPGIKDLVSDAETRIRDELQNSEHAGVIGYSTLLRRYTDDPLSASDEQIAQAARDTVPRVPVLFWAFRFMVATGIALVLLFVTGAYLCWKRQTAQKRWYLWLSLLALPLPWLAIDAGWLVAELGRQPWTVAGVLPTVASGGALAADTVQTTLIGFLLAYGTAAVLNLWLTRRFIRKGPVSAESAGDAETGITPVGLAPSYEKP